MKPSIALCLLVLSGATFHAHGQTEIQLIVNPTFSTRHMTASTEHKEIFNEVEKGMLSFDAGIMVTPLKFKRVDFSTGLIYSRKGFKWIDGTGRDIDGNEMDLKVKESINFLEIPVQMRYYCSRNSTDSYLILGLLNDVFLSSHIKGPGVEQTQELRKHNIGINFGIGYNFTFSDSLRVAIEPNMKFQTMHLLETSVPAKRYLYTIGITVNTKFKV